MNEKLTALAVEIGDAAGVLRDSDLTTSSEDLHNAFADYVNSLKASPDNRDKAIIWLYRAVGYGFEGNWDKSNECVANADKLLDLVPLTTAKSK